MQKQKEQIECYKSLLCAVIERAFLDATLEKFDKKNTKNEKRCNYQNSHRDGVRARAVAWINSDQLSKYVGQWRLNINPDAVRRALKNHYQNKVSLLQSEKHELE